jgi:hypothetical protein
MREFKTKDLLLAIVVAALIVLIPFGQHALAAGPVRTRLTGYELTYALNGSLKYIQTVTDAAVGTITFSTAIEDGADVWIQCSVDSYYINLNSGDSNAVIAKMPKVPADELRHVGILTAGVTQIGVDTTGASSDCKLFQAY